VDVYAMARITIGSKVAISQRSFVRRYPRHPQFATPLVTREIVIKDHVWVAAESFIHPGCVVGEGCVVGARSVVTSDLPAWMICVGAPPPHQTERHRTMKQVKRMMDKTWKLMFSSASSFATCSRFFAITATRRWRVATRSCSTRS
jgi:carbonic anhydrase/acetyltransferase-like protein (isoleucine patch superfamily)